MKYFPGPWSPDGRGFYLLTDRGREYLGLAFFDLAAGDLDWVETPEWDVEAIALSRDGRWLAWVVNEGGWSRLQVRDTTGGQVKEFADLPRGVCGALTFSPAGPVLGLAIARSVSPANLYVVHVESGEVVQLTQSFLGGVPATNVIAVNPNIVLATTPPHAGGPVSVQVTTRTDSDRMLGAYTYQRHPTAMLLSSSANPSGLGERVTFTAFVSSTWMS